MRSPPAAEGGSRDRAREKTEMDSAVATAIVARFVRPFAPVTATAATRAGPGLTAPKFEHDRFGRRRPPLFIRQRKQRLAFSGREAVAGVFAQEEQHEREDQAETDRQGERNNGHGGWADDGGWREFGGKPKMRRASYGRCPGTAARALATAVHILHERPPERA